jgi:hypothetical protein
MNGDPSAKQWLFAMMEALSRDDFTRVAVTLWAWAGTSLFMGIQLNTQFLAKENHIVFNPPSPKNLAIFLAHSITPNIPIQHQPRPTSRLHQHCNI